MSPEYKFATPETIIQLVEFMFSDPETRAALATGKGKDRMTPESEVVVSRAVRLFEKRATKEDKTEYQFLSYGITIARMIVDEKYTGPGDPKILERLKQVLPKKT